MILDASAVVAILLKEPGWDLILQKLAAEEQVGIGVPTLVEAAVVLSFRMRKDARPLLSRLLAEAGIVPIPFAEEHYSAAITCWLRYGKGRHRAALNFGDCLAYAIAKTADEPLLFTGNDFALTDLKRA